MKFNLNKSLEILERTPTVLKTLLSGLSNDWAMQNEGGETWSPYDVLGHLIHGERTDWMQRINIILDANGDKKFATFDRFAQFEESQGKSLDMLLNEFESIRDYNLRKLKSLNLNDTHYALTGIHPKFGEVTMENLLSTWTVHDLAHIGQIVRVMAKQYKEEVGPWIEYLRILQS